MNQPWETLLGHLADNWMLRDYLEGDGTPPIRRILADERFPGLSSGEQALIYAAEAILRLNECYLAVDTANQIRLTNALRIAVDA